MIFLKFAERFIEVFTKKCINSSSCGDEPAVTATSAGDRGDARSRAGACWLGDVRAVVQLAADLSADWE